MTARLLDGQVRGLPKAVRAMAQEIARAVDRKSPGTVLQAEDAAIDMAHWMLEPVCCECGRPQDQHKKPEQTRSTGCPNDWLAWSDGMLVTRAEYEHRKRLLDRKVRE